MPERFRLDERLDKRVEFVALRECRRKIDVRTAGAKLQDGFDRGGVARPRGERRARTSGGGEGDKRRAWHDETPGVDADSAVTDDVPNSQMLNIQTGMPGHVLVNIHIGGNDLAPFIFQSDQAAMDAFGPLIADGLAVFFLNLFVLFSAVTLVGSLVWTTVSSLSDEDISCTLFFVFGVKPVGENVTALGSSSSSSPVRSLSDHD